MKARPLFLMDVEEAAYYLSTAANEEVALRWLEALKKTLGLLSEFLKITRLRFDLPNEHLRSFQLLDFPNWLVFFRLTGEHLELLRVQHAPPIRI